MDQQLARPWLQRANYPLDWMGTGTRAFAPFAFEKLERPIIDLFMEHVRATPGKIAIDDGAQALSFAQTAQMVRALAARIAETTKPGEAVGAAVPACADFPITMLACLAAGRIFVALDLHYPKAWLSEVMTGAGLAAVVGRFAGDAASLVPEGVARIDLDTLPDDAPDFAFTPAGPDDPAYVIFTSGSTGTPKGIVNSQRAMLRRVEQHVNAGHLHADDRFMPLSSGCTIAGLRERLSALTLGATLYEIDVQKAGARKILERLEDCAITVIYAVPALLRTLMALGVGPSHMHVVRVGGEAVLWSDIDQLQAWLPKDCLIQLGYSCSEAPILQWFVPKDFPREGTRIPIGYALEANELAVLDDEGVAVAPGEVGELVVKSPYVALGHWRNGALDRSPFPAAKDDPNSRILRTRDLVRLRADGFFDLIGRKDRMVKIRGIRIEPGEVEAVLRKQDGVADVAVLPRRLGKTVTLIGYVVAKDGAAETLPAALKSALKPVLPAHMQPQRLYKIDEIPRLPSGKLDMKALEIVDRGHQTDEAEGAADAPSTDETARGVEATVAAIWKRLLDLPQIDRDADFFDLGGDSLMTLNMMFALEEELGAQLPVTLIFEAPTIASLAAAIEDGSVQAANPLVLMKPGEGAPLFIVHGVGGNVMELFALGRRIEHAGPVYAVQARGLDGRGEPSRCIAAMAADYLGVIREAFPQGSYHLAGYSSGGLVAYEMAQRLAAEGMPAASLTLLDTQTNSRQWPLAVWLEVLVRRARHHGEALRSLTWRARLAYAAGAAKGFKRLIFWRLGLERAAPQRESSVSVPATLQKVYEATLEAVAAYRPARYGYPVALIASADGHPRMADARRIWPRHVSALAVHTAPGTHFSMIAGENAAVTAKLISEALKIS